MILIRLSKFTFPFFGTQIHFSKIHNIFAHLISLHILHNPHLFSLCLLNRPSSHLQRQHLSCRPCGIFLPSLPSLSPRSKSLSFQCGGTTVKDKDWFYAEEEKFTDSTEE